MTSAAIAHADHLNDHELQKLADKTVELLRLSIVQGLNNAMNPQVYKAVPREITVGRRVAKKYPSASQVVVERFKNLNPARVNGVRLALGRDLSITKGIRTTGLDIRSEKTVLEQLDLRSHFSFVNDTTFNEGSVTRMAAGLSVLNEPLGTSLARERFLAGLPTGVLTPAGTLVAPGTGQPPVVNRGVKFRIHEVKCIDETNPEWAGGDEISWGGAAVDDKGVTSTIPERKVGGGFDDGDRKSYSPPELIKTFSLDGTYPKEFMIAMTLAEKDSGGMSKFIAELYEAIKAEIGAILETLGAAAGAYIGAQIGGSVGTAIGGPLGTIIGVVAGAILGALIGWLVSALSDDIFPTQASSLFLYTAADTFPGGGLVSPPLQWHFRDHGGHYQITYDWEITR